MRDPAPPPPGRVLVTGANGYVASWVVKRLLELGCEVRATVRDPADPVRTGHLEAIAKGLPGSLSLHGADLLDPSGFDRAMEGCATVLHTASPVIARGVGDPVRELIEPAVDGTRNVIEAVNRCSSVRRVVLTSSVVAVYGDAVDMARTAAGRFDESHWNETSGEDHQPYSYSKARAERLAWEMAGRQDRWDLVVVNPGLVLGPALSPHTNSESVRMMRDLGDGLFRLGAPRLEFGVVDVRDVADAHVRAATRPDANGRHILVAETLGLGEIAGMLRERFGDGHPFPRRTMPKFAATLLAPLRGLERAVVRRNVGHPLRFDNRRARDRLGLAFRPVAETVADHFRQLLDDGLVRVRAPLPPGPRGGRLWHLIARLRDFPGLLEELHDGYGDIVRYRVMNREFCAVADPGMIREILVTQRESFHKTAGYKNLRPFGNPTIVTADGAEHGRRRKLYQPSFGSRGMAAYSEIMLERASAMRESWRDGQTVDVAAEMRDLAMGIAVTAFFGRDMRVDPRIGTAVLDGILRDFVLGVLPFTGLLRALPLPGKRRAERAWGALDEIVHEAIRRARRAGGERADMISLLVNARDEEGVARPFTDDEVRDEAYTLLMTGHETSSSAMTWCLDHIMRHPHVRQRLEREVDEVVGRRPVAPDDYSRLPHARAVFNEALRHTPPIFFLGREAIEDCVVGGYRIRKGTIVQPCIRVVHHCPTHYPDPDAFDPGRWTDAESAKRAKPTYLPFGTGPRMCIAWGFATMEAVYTLANIVQRWRLEPVLGGSTPVSSTGVYRVAGALPAIVRERDRGRTRIARGRNGNG